MEINFKMKINQQQVSLPFTSSSGDEDDDSVNQPAAADDVSFGGDDDNNNNQQLKPDGFVNPLADDDDVSTGFNCLRPEGSVNQSAGDDVSFGDDSNNNNNQQLKPDGFVNPSEHDDVSTGFICLRPEGSVNQSADDDDVSTGFRNLHIDDANANNQHPKPEDSVNQMADDDVSTGFNRLKPEASVDQSADDDVSTGDDNRQQLKPDDSGDQSAADDVSSGDSVGQSEAADDVSFYNDSVNQSANDDVSFNNNNNNNNNNSVDQSANGDVSFGLNHLQIDTISPEIDVEDEEEEDDDDVEGDFTFACVGDDTDSFNGYETGEIRTVYPLFDQSLLSGDDYNDGKLKLPVNVPVNKIYIESPSNNGTVHALSDETGSMKMKSNSTGFSKLWRFRKEMNRSNSDSRDAFVFFEKSTEKVNATGRSTEKVNVAGGKGKAVRKDLSLKKVAASAHEVYLKQKAGQPEEERRRSYLPYRPGLMGFFTNVNGGLSKNVHPF